MMISPAPPLSIHKIFSPAPCARFPRPTPSLRTVHKAGANRKLVQWPGCVAKGPAGQESGHSEGVVAQAAAAEGGVGDEAKESVGGWKLLAAAVPCILFGVANRVSYKMALVPLQDYVFFLAQFQTFGYLGIYFTILHLRKRAGLVTSQMLSIPKRPFAIIGLCEALGQVSMLIGAAKLPGVLLPLFNQTIIVWQIVLSAIFLGQRYSFSQLSGAALVIAGGVVAAMASMSGMGSLSPSLPSMAFFLIGIAFPCIAVITKEKVFADAKKSLGGKDLDLFVVNSFGSLAQAVCVLLLLPVLTTLRNIPLSQLPNYLLQGSKCFVGINPTCGADCAGAPLLPLLYIAANIMFNISALNLVRTAGGVVAMLSVSLVVPLAVFTFTLPLPYLGAQPQITTSFLVGCLLVCSGILTYNQKDIMGLLKKEKASD